MANSSDDLDDLLDPRDPNFAKAIFEHKVPKEVKSYPAAKPCSTVAKSISQVKPYLPAKSHSPTKVKVKNTTVATSFSLTKAKLKAKVSTQHTERKHSKDFNVGNIQLYILVFI